ncbi:S-layer homology domain-containing protein [Bacillus thuringiensis]|uniref:S-layer homology domain-containing protein n=4 Tax=Bacillus thuringiensis TaxID=1428 RepID=UPI0007C1CA6E|nr:S-layer homology domain-containing protein [Bacillus thuringiensis]AND11156.1 cell surface protein [Bacillus thuringiensis serovar alesti]MEC3599434.1 S-layer homology domain-containing protein [Bacillus thuringiensis]MED1837847.1 S-layer homology domain-containing protein [Bacillus thuringiensis]MED2207580.1 S-layer homology domain-containing protein [Bacillus thuringiensis]MED2670314.1 S-layer homology domain-containing protein [Bacillus thuringiensis]
MKKLIYLEEQTMANKFLKTATALTIMGTSLLGVGAFTAKAADNTDSLKFNDVPANHWSTKAIYNLTNRKVVQGYGNNIFGFGDNVTRGQVARMIYMYVKPANADASFKNPFTDIKGHLFEKEILALAKAGLVNGFGDGKYGPDDILTREQMAQVLTNAFKFKATKTSKFADVDKNSWSYGAISALEENGVTIGTGDNMYSPKMFVTREAYSQFLYNSINAVEKETKPEVKPDPKPETKPEEKPEVKPDPKPETKPEEKPEVKPDPKPDVQLPAGMDSNLVTENIEYYPEAVEKMPVVKQQVSNEAQRIIKEVNGRFGTNLKYSEISNDVSLLDKNMYLPAGTIGAQFVVQSDNEGNYKIIFLDNNKATVSLTKEWTKLLSGLNLDNELQEAIDTQKTKVFEKDNFKIRIAHSTAEHMMYVEVEKK